jgi:large repetitive protein
MAATRLGLYELLAPQFLLGFTFPEHVDRYLSIVGVDELRTALDESAVVYTGRVSFVGQAGAAPERVHHDPSGAVLEWEDLTVDFRLTVPRDGAAFIDTAVKAPAITDPDLDALFTALGPVEQTPAVPTEYPGVRFRLELLVSTLSFHLGKTWRPGKVADFRVVPDPDLAGQDVKFVLPKIVLQYEQGDDLTRPPDFRLKSWGNSGFDAASDLDEGELVRMVPPIAVHESGRWGFGVDEILLDLSEDHTPPEILAFFGTDEAFEGLYLKSLRFFYADKAKDFALDFAINDALISFAGEVSLEAELDLLFAVPLTSFHVDVSFYNGRDKLQYARGTAADSSQPNVLTGGRATVPSTAVVQLDVRGGFPDFTIAVTLDTVPPSTATNLWDGTRRDARISPDMPGNLRPPGEYRLVVTVSDTTPTPNRFSQTIDLKVTTPATPAATPDGASADHPPEQGDRPAATLTIQSRSPDPLPEGCSLGFTPSSSGIAETIVVNRGTTPPTVTIGGTPREVNQRGEVTLDVPEGSDSNPIQIVVQYLASGPEEKTFQLSFDTDRPFDPTSSHEPRWPAVKAFYLNDDRAAHQDTPFADSEAPSRCGDGSGSQSRGAQALRDWIRDCVVSSPKTVTVEARASWEQDTRKKVDQLLSERRLEVAKGIIGTLAQITPESKATGFDQAKQDGVRADRHYRVALVTGLVKQATPSATITAVISRSRSTQTTTPPAVPSPPSSPHLPDRRPVVFRRLSFRVRLERNVLVLLDISGELDFETDMEKALRQADAGHQHEGDRLELQQRPGASANPTSQDGVVDFKLTVAYDTATNFLTETLTLGAAPGDIDGLLRMTNPRADGAPTGVNRLKDIFGALLVFAPVINSAAAALDPSSAGDWAVLGVSLAVPVTIGALDVFQTSAITLYGGEMKARQNIPPGQEVDFTDWGVVFDYGVEFGIHIGQLIKSKKSAKVRYKAVGFSLHFAGGVTYQPIFDTSKGYEIDLRDSGLLELPGALGDLLKVLGARIARFNPLTLEVDLGLKVDLGVITVDRFKVKWPIDPLGVPQILPTGVKVDISSVIVGSGYVNILDNGFEGTIDVTIVPVKVRVAASVGVQTIEDPARQRKATAVFAGIVVEFPSPIVLAATGLGIYGFSGLFAMHYKRLEDPRAPDDSVSPALRWLVKAKGDPSKLVADGVTLWGPELDRWSFGVGLILGTIDGGFLINFRGMFVLELPGPRILIFVKVQIIGSLPKLGDAELTVGILGVIDLDFNLGQLTVGIIVDLSIKDLIAIKLPVEIFFKFGNSRLWHLYIGTIRQPASALVLNLVRARGYFMLDGDKIEHFPAPSGERTLPGIALATGIEASVLFGDEGIGLYLRVAVGAHLGIAFSPFFIAGRLFLDGELHLFIIGIEAHGRLDVEAPDPTIIHGSVCGEIDFFFFSIEGCVEVTIGGGTRLLPAPSLVRGVYLQSHAPVLAAGQGGDRPIDASLGDAVALPSDAPGPTVPVDTIPVLQLHASPLVDSPTTATFTTPLITAPGQTTDAWINVGNDRQVRYRLKELSLDPPLPAGGDLPPATWRREQAPAPQGVDTNIDLALFSRIPATATRALERSTELEEQITLRWQDLCKAVAPPACVLWTFCGQPLGPSGHGWDLTGGIPQPDPPDTTRNAPPPTRLVVEESSRTAEQALLDLLLEDAGQPFPVAARVIGVNAPRQPADPPSAVQLDPACFRALELPSRARQRQAELPLPPEALQRAAASLDEQWVAFDTGAADSVTMLLAVATKLLTPGAVVVRQLDQAGAVIQETRLVDLAPQPVSGATTGLPPSWLDPAGPWRAQVLPVAVFLAGSQFSALRRLLVTLKPTQQCVRVELRVVADTLGIPQPAVLVGVVVVCSHAEAARAAQEQAIQTGQIETLTGYLNGGDLVPLLEPDRDYTLRVRYDADSKAADGSVSTESDLVQSFGFRTDARHPARLDPWVLGTTPDHEEQHHFYEDLVKVVFNDVAVLQLFAAYGKRLRVAVRAADGIAVPSHEIDILALVAAELSTPYRDFLEAMVAAGLLPCVGSVTAPNHGSFSVPVPLRPLMAYTLDIEVDPADPSGNGDQPVTPLYRRSFSTSRFASIGALVEELQGTYIAHRPLTAQLSGLPTVPPVVTATDEELQAALQAAGEQALPAPTVTRLTIYWARPAGGASFAPHAILIDAAEPLWRTRVEPRLGTVPDQDDPAFQRVVLTPVAALEVFQQSGPHLARMVRSPSGTRTLCLFPDGFQPQPGDTITLALHRPESALYGIPAETHVLATIPLDTRAPWEEDQP